MCLFLKNIFSNSFMIFLIFFKNEEYLFSDGIFNMYSFIYIFFISFNQFNIFIYFYYYLIK